MQIKEIENVEPKEVMGWFKKICAIPHGSYHEQALSSWLADTLKKAGCEVQVYPSGMILAKQKASPGCEKWPTVLLQSHMDMVLAKTDKCDKDLVKEPIDPYYDTETEQIKAEHTSLGGDDGVGVATQLAIIHNHELIHGPLECLFTVNEEDHPGQCITEELKEGDVTAQYYINLDGEQFDELVHGGAGCTTMKFDCPIKQIPGNPKLETFRISLTGLKGGHSGGEACRPHINGITFLAQCVVDFMVLNDTSVTISKFDGGPINNSLPTHAKLDISIDPKMFEKLRRFIINQLLIAKKVAQNFEDEAVLAFDKIDNPTMVYDEALSTDILLFITLAPNKVFTMTSGESKMYSTSNLGYVNIDDGRMKVDFKIRSYIDGEIQRIVRKIAALGKLLGFNNYKQDGQLFAFINSLKDNHVAKVWSDVYKEVTKKDIKQFVCPGGLECAAVCSKNLSMIPNTIVVNTSLFNCHSPTESFSVQDTIKFWKIIKKVLANLKE